MTRRRNVVRKPDEIGHNLAIRSDTVKNCKVCRLGHPLVGMVNRQIISGAPYMDVFRELNKLYVSGNLSIEPPSYQSIRNHGAKHLKVGDDAIRRHMELRAMQVGKDTEEGIENILTEMAAVENVMIMGHQEMVEGKSKVTVKDMLVAAKMKREFDRQDADADAIDEIRAEMDMLLQAVKTVVPEQYHQAIANKIDELQTGEEILQVETEAEEEFVIPPDERFTS